MASVASTQPTTSAALAQLKGWTAQIRNALLAAGALNDEISLGTAYVQPNTQETGQVTSFTMSQTVTVQSSRLTAMQRVLGSVIICSPTTFPSSPNNRSTPSMD